MSTVIATFHGQITLEALPIRLIFVYLHLLAI